MGQSQSTSDNAAASDERTVAPLREADVQQLRTQLTRLVEAIHLVEATRDGNEDEGSHAGAAVLQPWASISLSGYELGDASLTEALPVPALPSTRQHRTSSPAQQHQGQLTVCALLGRHAALTSLDLSYNHLTSAVMEPLLLAIGTLPLLTVLKLSGNPLGSAGTPAAPPSEDDTRAGEATEELSLEQAPAETAHSSAAALLGRWLATHPPLQELSLFHCSLNDRDVHALLHGLVPPHATPSEKTSAPLHTLQLAGNAACTSMSARLALQLVRDLGNTALRVVELEGAPPGMEVRLEYACTAQGRFRSGRTLFEGELSMPAQDDGEDDAMLAQLSPAQSARFRSRCRLLREDLDGCPVMDPAVMQELADVLAARQPAFPQRTTTKHASSVGDVERGGQRHDGADVQEAANEEAEGDDSTIDETGSHMADEGAGEGDSQHPLSSEIKDGSAGQRKAAAASSPSPSASRGGRPPAEWQMTYSSFSPQAKRAARFEAPQRLARVMEEAAAFRQRLHPIQADTYAPPCAEASSVRRHGGTAASSASSAGTWYAAEGFVLRPNGFSKVLVAPVLPGALNGGAGHLRNVDLDDLQDQPLQPCWCTPQNSASAATFAGTLHYHCVREGEAVQHGGGAAATEAGASMRKRAGAAAAAASAGGFLPPLSADGRRLPKKHVSHGGGGGGSRVYHGCLGTGHTCLSASVAAQGALHSRRMRTALTTQSTASRLRGRDLSPASVSSSQDASYQQPMRPSTMTGGLRSSPASFVSGGGHGGGSSVRGTSAPRTPSASIASRKSAAAAAAAAANGARPLSNFGGARTVHTTSGGASVALNYSPVAYFTAPHVPCAAGIEVEECS